MKDELGSEVSDESIAVYRSILNPPKRGHWVALGVSVLLIGATLIAYIASLTHDAWNAYLCHKSEGTWSRAGACVAPTIEVKHYTIDVKPDALPPQSDIPKPPPVPSTAPQTL